MRKNTKQIIKERLSVLAVIFSCLAMVVVAQGAQQFISQALQPPTATPLPATPTPLAETKKPTEQTASQNTAASSGDLASSPTQKTPGKASNYSGKWAGSFFESVDGSAYEYQYNLELSQQGAFISGRSTIQTENDPGAFAKFVIRGQISPKPDAPAMQLTEELLEAENLPGSSAVAPRIIRLDYFSSEDQEYLEGEWIDRRYTSENITGTVRLTKQ